MAFYKAFVAKKKKKGFFIIWLKLQLQNFTSCTYNHLITYDNCICRKIYIFLITYISILQIVIIILINVSDTSQSKHNNVSCNNLYY